MRARVMRAPTTSWWWNDTPSLPIERVRGLPTSWNSAASRTMRSGRVLATTAIVWASTSLWWWIGSCSRRIAGSSGRKWSASPVSTTNHSPADGSSTTTSLSSSSRMRSADTISSRSAMATTASRSPSSGVSPYPAMNRAARIIRSGSSPKESSGPVGVRRIPAARSAAPPNGSMSSGSGTASAIALTVKSRRERSASISVEKATSGLRESGRYDSARWVVISTVRSPRLAPIVPKRAPWSHTASAQPERIAVVWSGSASVVRSRSPPRSSRPSRRSRTIPPTR